MSNIKVKVTAKIINVKLSVLSEINVSAVPIPSNIKVKTTGSNSTII
jgi:hypothetical protein